MTSSVAATCGDADDKNLDGLEFELAETSDVVEAQAAAGARPKRAASSQQPAGTAEHLPSLEEGSGEPSPNEKRFRGSNKLVWQVGIDWTGVALSFYLFVCQRITRLLPDFVCFIDYSRISQATGHSEAYKRP